jgi:integrase
MSGRINTASGQAASALNIGIAERTPIRAQGAAEASRFRRAGDRSAAAAAIATAKDPAALVAEVTQHRLRHKLATEMMVLTGNLRAVMEQGGWRDVESVMAYIHDVPARRRELTDTLPIGDTRSRDSRDKIALAE